MIYAVWFDVEDPACRGPMEYFDIELLSPYWKSAIDDSYRLSNSAYCGALFLGIL